ncbi:hypothetical protein [Burkholderia oklahomensis]|uniref:hypothetical protein n=1 Tax=Burkholderia oklahomensis TaxID=342113 RepID=UPI000F53EE3C|nr:hypothetical protein [Burkholderia oklahomensis]MBI0363035.1 hypothetical protein [Burkholderia oklahomensis]
MFGVVVVSVAPAVLIAFVALVAAGPAASASAAIDAKSAPPAVCAIVEMARRFLVVRRSGASGGGIAASVFGSASGDGSANATASARLAIPGVHRADAGRLTRAAT